MNANQVFGYQQNVGFSHWLRPKTDWIAANPLAHTVRGIDGFAGYLRVRGFKRSRTMCWMSIRRTNFEQVEPQAGCSQHNAKVGLRLSLLLQLLLFAGFVREIKSLADVGSHSIVLARHRRQRERDRQRRRIVDMAHMRVPTYNHLFSLQSINIWSACEKKQKQHQQQRELWTNECEKGDSTTNMINLRIRHGWKSNKFLGSLFIRRHYWWWWWRCWCCWCRRCGCRLSSHCSGNVKQ